jgi:hypothetical protein
MRVFCKLSVLALLVSAVTAASAGLINNGGFEAGLSGWTEFDQSGGSGTWFAATGFSAPLSGEPTVGPASGSMYALTDQTGPGSHVLFQGFTVGGGGEMLSFDMFVNDWAGVIVGCGGLDYTVSPTECGRVDILSSVSDPFCTGACVVQNLYMGADNLNGNPNPYTHYNFDLNLAAGTYWLRFAEADNQSYFNMGVDNVDLQQPTPEPGTLILFGSAVVGMASVLRRKLKM